MELRRWKEWLFVLLAGAVVATAWLLTHDRGISVSGRIEAVSYAARALKVRASADRVFVLHLPPEVRPRDAGGGVSALEAFAPGDRVSGTGRLDPSHPDHLFLRFLWMEEAPDLTLLEPAEDRIFLDSPLTVRGVVRGQDSRVRIRVTRQPVEEGAPEALLREAWVETRQDPPGKHRRFEAAVALPPGRDRGRLRLEVSAAGEGGKVLSSVRLFHEKRERRVKLYFPLSRPGEPPCGPLQAVERRFAYDPQPEEILLHLLAGPGEGERRRGLGSAFPPEAELLEVTVRGGAALVNLTRVETGEQPCRGKTLRLQVERTLMANYPLWDVAFLVDGLHMGSP